MESEIYLRENEREKERDGESARDRESKRERALVITVFLDCIHTKNGTMHRLQDSRLLNSKHNSTVYHIFAKL